MRLNVHGKTLFEFPTRYSGDLVAFSLRMKDTTEVEKRLGSKLESALPELYARALASVICYPKASLGEDGPRPGTYAFGSMGELRIDEDELEAFASNYLEQNEYLYRERITDVQPQEGKDGVRVSSRLGDVAHPRLEGESSVTYLHRLVAIDQKKNSERLKKTLGLTAVNLAKQFGGMYGFSESLKKELGTTLRMGDSLRRSYEGIFAQPIVRPFESDLADSAARMEKIQESLRETSARPHRELIERLDALINSEANTAEFIVQVNETQVKVADELRASSDSSNRYARRNIWLNAIIIALTVASLAVAATSLYVSVVSSREQSNYIRLATEKMIRHLEALDSSAASGRGSQEELTQEVRQLRALLAERLPVRGASARGR